MIGDASDEMSDSQDDEGFFWMQRKMVRVICGSSEGWFQSLVGDTVATVRDVFRQRYNIPDTAIALVDGEPAEDSDVLREGTTLEFVNR